MKTIPESAYKNLTMSQRFQAAIAAYGRNDQTEIDRLAETSDSGAYTINKLHTRLNDFTAMTMALNLDLMSCLANWLLAQPWKDFDEDSDRPLSRQVIEQSITDCASIVAARNQWIKSHGIPIEDYECFNIDLPMLKNFIKRAEGKEDPTLTAEILDQIQSFFHSRHAN